MTIHDFYLPFQKYFRTKRMNTFERRFKPTSDTCILDVGGTPFNWTLIKKGPAIYFMNLVAPEGDATGNWIVADARALPFKDKSFDIVYSNSLIEHLGDFNSQRFFADEVRRVGQTYHVQTPNKWFPVETHLVTLFVHWLPNRIQKRLWRWLSLRVLLAPRESLAFMENLRLLTEKDMRRLFPDAEVWLERFSGLCKSIIVVKT